MNVIFHIIKGKKRAFYIFFNVIYLMILLAYVLMDQELKDEKKFL